MKGIGTGGSRKVWPGRVVWGKAAQFRDMYREEPNSPTPLTTLDYIDLIGTMASEMKQEYKREELEAMYEWMLLVSHALRGIIDNG